MEPMTALTATSRSTFFRSIPSRTISASSFSAWTDRTFSFRLTLISRLGLTSMPTTESTLKLA